MPRRNEVEYIRKTLETTTAQAVPPKAKPSLSVLGVPVHDLTMDEVLLLLERLIQERPRHAHSIFFVNTHTLNTAATDPDYRALLAGADYIFGDGTGVRWAARFLYGVRLRDNVNGTDLVPRIFRDLGGQGYRYFMLGNTPERIELAAEYARTHFPGWTLAGYHHGFVQPEDHARVVQEINESEADMLLVGMGNPKQEQWISQHLADLRVPLCLGIGGLFDYWASEIERAPAWVRRLGSEWVYVLLQQPHKARRYLLGNPLFLLRLAKSKWLDGFEATT